MGLGVRGQWNWLDGLTGTSHPRTKFGAQLQCVTGQQLAPGQVTLEIYYGGSRVPSTGISFTYCENPMIRAFEPLRSFVRCGLSPFWLVPSPPPPADLRNVAELGWAGQEERSSGKPHCTLMGFLLRTEMAGSEQGHFPDLTRLSL